MAHLPIEREAAPLHVHRREGAAAVALQQQPVARVVAPLGGRDAGEVAGDDQIDFPIAIDILSERRVDRRKLRLRRQRAQLERAVAAVQRDHAGERVGLEHARFLQFLLWNEVLNPTRTE